MIDSNFIQSALMDVGKSVIAVSVSKALKIPERVDFGDSFVARNASQGAITFLSSDAIDGITGQGSKVFNMDWIGAVDEALFFSAVSGGAEFAGLDNGLYQQVESKLGLTPDMSATVTDSVILSTSRVLSRYLEQQNDIAPYLKTLRYPMQTLMNMKQ